MHHCLLGLYPLLFEFNYELTLFTGLEEIMTVISMVVDQETAMMRPIAVDVLAVAVIEALEEEEDLVMTGIDVTTIGIVATEETSETTTTALPLVETVVDGVAADVMVEDVGAAEVEGITTAKDRILEQVQGMVVLQARLRLCKVAMDLLVAPHCHPLLEITGRQVDHLDHQAHR